MTEFHNTPAIDPRGPMRKAVAIAQTTEETLVTLSCDHVSRLAAHFHYKVGSDYHCYACGLEQRTISNHKRNRAYPRCSALDASISDQLETEEGNEKMKQIRETAKTTTTAAPKRAAKAKKKKAATVAAKKEPAAKPPTVAEKAAKRPTKKDRLAAMLRRDGGATVPQIMLEFGWLAHTSRAAICIAGKVPGQKITNEKLAGMVRVYRMAP